jgi:hypothetical protein
MSAQPVFRRGERALAQLPREEARWPLFEVELDGWLFRLAAASWVSLPPPIAMRPTSHLPDS